MVNTVPGRWSQLTGNPEVSWLEAGLDLRLPQYRRAAFHAFYQFTLRFRVHPGCVYFALPALAQHLGLNQEDKLWMAYVNGNTQNPVTTYLFLLEFPSLASTTQERVARWLQVNWRRADFDSDRRYWKNKFPKAIENYRQQLKSDAQQNYFASILGDEQTGTTEHAGFNALWDVVRENFYGMGRLSAFSYIEYLRIIGLPVQPGELFLTDMSGSKSHRNGLCKVLGRDDLDWHDSNPTFKGNYSKELLDWLASEAELLLEEAKNLALGQPWYEDVTYFTIESAFCTYKSCFRPNRRYPNVYADMMHDRIKKAESSWPDVDFSLFWEMRRRNLPRQLLLEYNPRDVGLHPLKQNFFRETGSYPMLNVLDPVFNNDYSDTFLERESVMV